MTHGRSQRWIVALAALGLWAVLSGVSASAPAEKAPAGDPDMAIASAREAFKARGHIPWYDADEDKLRPVEVFIWPDWNLRNWKLWEVPGELLKSLGWGLFSLLVAAFVVVLALCIVLIVISVRISSARSAALARIELDPVLHADQVEALPFMADRSHGDLLGQARHHYEQGNYSEAIIYLFSYQLVRLDKFALIHLARGKTNRQYLREAGRVRLLKQLLEQTMITFEDVFFGQRPLDRAGFEACWNQLGQFEDLATKAAT